MKNCDIIEYCLKNTDVEIWDVFKFIFQSCFGCEHLVSDEAKALEWILKESENAIKDDLPDIEYLDGDFCRVHLKALKNDDMKNELCRLFILSAKKVADGESRFQNELSKLLLYAKEGRIPFSETDVSEASENWRQNGFCAVHHSEKFRNAHHPAYRVIKKDYLVKLFGHNEE